MLRFRDFPLVAAVAIALYFGSLTAPGFSTLFAPDDFQNMYRYWNPGLGEVIRANLLFVTSFYRPLGAVFYLPLLHLFGFHPLPYRIVYHALLWLNLGLLYVLARRICRSRAAAGLAVLIGCFHAEAAGVYLSSSMIYEVLCFTFMVGCLIYYIRIRQSGRVLGARELGIFVLLYICALDSKEMAVVLPGILVVYELAYRPWKRPVFRELLPILLAGAMSIAYTIGKIFGADSLSRIPGYEPVYTIDQFLKTTGVYLGQLLMSGEPLAPGASLTFWAVLLALAAVFRRRAMWFGMTFAFLAFLPLNFVPPRQAFVLYIPLAGFGIYMGDLITTVVDFITARTRLSEGNRSQVTAMVFAACFVAVAVIQTPPAMMKAGEISLAQQAHWKVIQELERLKPHAKPGGQLLLVDSPLEAEWDLYFIAKLYLNDHALKVAWTHAPKPRSATTGDFVGPPDNEWRFDGNKLVQVK